MMQFSKSYIEFVFVMLNFLNITDAASARARHPERSHNGRQNSSEHVPVCSRPLPPYWSGKRAVDKGELCDSRVQTELIIVTVHLV